MINMYLPNLSIVSLPKLRLLVWINYKRMTGTQLAKAVNRHPSTIYEHLTAFVWMGWASYITISKSQTYKGHQKLYNLTPAGLQILAYYKNKEEWTVEYLQTVYGVPQDVAEASIAGVAQ